MLQNLFSHGQKAECIFLSPQNDTDFLNFTQGAHMYICAVSEINSKIQNEIWSGKYNINVILCTLKGWFL